MARTASHNKATFQGNTVTCFSIGFLAYAWRSSLNGIEVDGLINRAVTDISLVFPDWHGWACCPRMRRFLVSYYLTEKCTNNSASGSPSIFQISAIMSSTSWFPLILKLLDDYHFLDGNWCLKSNDRLQAQSIAGVEKPCAHTHNSLSIIRGYFKNPSLLLAPLICMIWILYEVI